MEPIHYLRAFRRRWWVIALSVLVAGSAAWITTEATSDARSASSDASAGYAVKIVLWNPGAPVVGPGYPITSTAALAEFVKLPDVAEIAADIMFFQRSPDELSSRVSAAVDPTTGFLVITGTGKDPRSADAVANAFSRGLIVYLARRQTEQIDSKQQLLQQQLTDLIRRESDPVVIATVRKRIAGLSIDRTTPIPLTEFDHQAATPLSEVNGSAAPADEGGFTVPESTLTRVLLASLLGLFAGLALALVLERFDTRLRSSRRAEEAFGLPVLAEVPAISQGRRDGVVTASHPYSRAADAFRLVQVGTSRWTSQNGNGDGHANGDRDGTSPSSGAKTILVTSPEARDGKTTVAANLAAAYAQAGNRVLVVSCDLRRPAIHEVFGVDEEPGLTDALRSTNGKTDPTAPLDVTPFLEPCSVLRVAVLPSGRTTERPGEVLGSTAMQELGERLKKITDVVILDCAPLVVAGDVVPLLPLADGVVLVARAGKTRQELAASAATLLERLGSPNAGVVLNDAREFSIPLAKRRMYRPTRKMKKASKRNPDPPDQEPWVPAPFTPEPHVVEPSSVVEEPGPAADEPPASEEPPTIAETPRADEEHAVPEGSDGDVEGPRRLLTRVADPGGGGPTLQGGSPALHALQHELTQLRAELEGFQIDFSDGSAADREAAPHPIGFLNRPANEPPRG